MESMSTHRNYVFRHQSGSFRAVDTASTGMDPHQSPTRTELDLLTEQELAAHLKICRRQLYNWRVAGIIPYFKMGKAVRFRVADVAAAIERMRVG
jgi:excisionase family DNA binding protein